MNTGNNSTLGAITSLNPDTVSQMSEVDKLYFSLLENKNFGETIHFEDGILVRVPILARHSQPHIGTYPFNRKDLVYYSLFCFKPTGYSYELLIYLISGDEDNFGYQIREIDRVLKSHEYAFSSFKDCVVAGAKKILEFVSLDDITYKDDDEDDEYEDNPDFEDFVKVVDANEGLAEKVKALSQSLFNMQMLINQKNAYNAKARNRMRDMMKLLTSTGANHTHAERNEQMLKAIGISLEVTEHLDEASHDELAKPDTIPF